MGCSPPGSSVHGIFQAPRAAFPSGCLAAQTKRWAEGIRVPAPLAGVGIYFFFLFYFIFKLNITVLDLPNIKMNPPQVYMYLQPL